MTNEEGQSVHVYHILGGVEIDEIEAMMESPQQPDGSQDLLGVVWAPTEHAARLGWKLVKGGQLDCMEEALVRGLFYLSLKMFLINARDWSVLVALGEAFHSNSSSTKLAAPIHSSIFRYNMDLSC